MLHLSPTTLSLVLNRSRPKKEEEDGGEESHALNVEILEIFSEKNSGEWASRQEKRYNRKSNKTRQKNKRGDSKVGSNDSPEIPDRWEDIRHPRPPFGERRQKHSGMSRATTSKEHFPAMKKRLPTPDERFSGNVRAKFSTSDQKIFRAKSRTTLSDLPRIWLRT